jgi:hypothetical protein
MSDESMFTGQKFVIPYDTKSDAHASMMARALSAPGTSTPGEVLHIGEMTLAIGITKSDLKMDSIDLNTRGFDQLAAPAQDAIRRNIEMMYRGAQATDSRK